MNIKFPDLPQFRFIRPMQRTNQDFEALAACFNTFNDPESWPSGFGGRTHTKESVAQYYGTRNLDGHFVATDPNNPDRIIGICFCTRGTLRPNTWYVDLLGVDPAYQKKGFGKALLMEALRFTLEHDGELLFLNTWSGNLKAMPLYKRQGYKWRPNTDVLMENYLPQILTFPPFIRFFEQHCWYDVFKPLITQEPDEELENNMWIYSYVFKAENGDGLKVWIDRAVGAICGFDIRSRYLNLQCKMAIPNSEAFIGLDTVPVTLSLKNEDNHKLQVNLEAILSEHLVIKNQSSLTVCLAPREEKTVTFLVSLVDSTPEKDLRINPTRYTDVAITVRVTINNVSFPLKVGIIPRKAIFIKPEPEIPMYLDGMNNVLTVNLINRTQRGLPILLSIRGSENMELENTESFMTVSPLDASFQVPFSLKNPSSSIEEDTVTVRTENGNAKLDERKIGMFVYVDRKTLIWEENEDYIVSNGTIILQVPKIPKKINSVLLSSLHRQIPRVRCAPLILGYPFDVSGSEFHAKSLDHVVQSVERGIQISSSAPSDVRKGVRLTRRITVYDLVEGIEVSFELENTRSDADYDNLGVMLELWMEHHDNPSFIYFPSHEGVQVAPLGLVNWALNVEKNVFSEGWLAFDKEKGVIGLLFDTEEVVRIEQQGPFYLVEISIGDVKRGDLVHTTPMRVIFASSWQEVRQQWHVWKKGKQLPREKMREEPRNFLQFGWHVNATSTPSRSLLLDKNDPNFQVGYQCVIPKKLSGKIILPQLDSMMLEPRELRFENQLTKKWHVLAKAKFNFDKKIHSGQLVVDLTDRMIKIPASVVTYNSKKEVSISVHNDEGGFQRIEVNNGYLIFKACPQYSAAAFHLGLAEDPNFNYLKSFYPEVRPYLFFDQFFGGIVPQLSPVGLYHDRRFRELDFTTEIVSKGSWQGVAFRSPFITHDERMKGLQCTVRYWTLPEAPLILVDLEIVNKSGINRTIMANITTYLNCTGEGNDVFYCEEDGNRGILHASDHGAYIGFGGHSRVAFYQRPDARKSLGAVLLSERFLHLEEGIGVATNNLDIATISVYRNKVSLASQARHLLRMAFILADSWDQVVPLKDLWESLP